ncbi:alpha/beta hydrolase [Thermoleophilia bacterium SCSIO 60948]|nr:alpha/beta hydrolase [Thermoleophilia bacterium SCSIO 60948]
MTEHLPQMLRAGVGEPVILLHGVTNNASVWSQVVPLVGREFDAIAPTALGHLGGREPSVRPARIAHLLDDLELTMDRLEIETAHFAGNSMGGWMALEMARRGRARSVCALSPAGTWDGDSGKHRRTRSLIRMSAVAARIATPTLGVTSRSATLRKLSLRSAAEHGDRVPPAVFRAVAESSANCVVMDDILATDETLLELDPVPCPISIVWSEFDRILPLKVNGQNARKLVPGADWSVMRGVGHVPMLDDPEGVARRIVEHVRAAEAAGG